MGSPLAFLREAETSIHFSPINGKAHQTLLEARRAGRQLIPGARCCFVFHGRGSERVGAAVAMATAAAASVTRGHDSLKEQFPSRPRQCVDPAQAAFPPPHARRYRFRSLSSVASKEKENNEGMEVKRESVLRRRPLPSANPPLITHRQRMRRGLLKATQALEDTGCEIHTI